MFFQHFTPKNSIALQSMNFSNSFEPLFFLSSIFGFYPFTIVRNQSGIIVGCCVSSFDIVLFVLNIALHIITAGLGSPIIRLHVSTFSGFVNATTHLSVTGTHLFPLGQSIAVLLSIVLNLLNRSRFIEIFKAFDAFDKEVHILLFFFIFFLKKIM